MIENSTAQVETTTALTNYDNRGAMIYIVTVLLWYSIGIIFMLGMQMRARSETIEDSARRRTKLLIRNLRDHTNTKEILEELVDKQKRARLWDIYLGTTNSIKDKLTRAETVRIRNIEKQLATINRNRRFTNDTLFSPDNEVRCCRSRSDSRQTATKTTTIEIPTTLRRRSSFDQQTLERWKALANRSRTQEQMPWTIRKLVIRRYFRRHTKRPLSTIHQNPDPATDCLLSSSNRVNILRRHQSEVNLHHTPEYSERQNPYLTYFYTASNRPSILTPELFSVTLDHSIE